MIEFNPVGFIYTPFKTIENMPIQSAAAAGFKGRIVIKDEFTEGLKDIEFFSHIHLIYHFNECAGYSLIVKPFLDDKKHGIFATRSPKRPCPIGMSIVKITGVSKNEIFVENVDMLDKTPILDIKPYIPEFDLITDNVEIGWYRDKPRALHETKSDNRFK